MNSLPEIVCSAHQLPLKRRFRFVAELRYLFDLSASRGHRVPSLDYRPEQVAFVFFNPLGISSFGHEYGIRVQATMYNTTLGLISMFSRKKLSPFYVSQQYEW